MRKIDLHIIHCADTPPSMDIGVKEIRGWHVNERGWSDIGYHYVIRRCGVIENGRPFAKAGAHCRGKNRNSIGTCLVGGRHGSRDFTEAQYESLEMLHSKMLLLYPGIKMFGHHHFDDSKTCPNFDPTSWWDMILLRKYNDKCDREEAEMEIRKGFFTRIINLFKRIIK